MSLHALLADLNPWWADRAARPPALPHVRRELQPRVMRRLVGPSDRGAVILCGPRQVGKSTLVQQVIDDLLAARWPASALTYFDFADDRAGPRPVSARAIVQARPPEAKTPPRASSFSMTSNTPPRARRSSPAWPVSSPRGRTASC